MGKFKAGARVESLRWADVHGTVIWVDGNKLQVQGHVALIEPAIVIHIGGR